MGLSFLLGAVIHRLLLGIPPTLHCLSLVQEIQSFSVHVQNVQEIGIDYVTQILDYYWSSYNFIQNIKIHNKTSPQVILHKIHLTTFNVYQSSFFAL